MPSYVLTDVDEGIFREEWVLDCQSGPQLEGSDDWSISKYTLRGGLSDGVDVVTLDNGALSMSVLPTRGMGLWRGDYGDIPIEWLSPVARPVNPQFVNLQERSGLGWLNGFNELLCRCGLAWNGPPGVDRVLNNNGDPIDTELTLHGKIANLPAHFVEVEVTDRGPGTLSVTGVVDESMMFGPNMQLTSTVSTVVGSNAITIHDRVTNLAAQPAELELLYHTNIGGPFLEEGSKLVAAFKECAPRDPHSASSSDDFDTYPGPQAGFTEEAFFFELAGDNNGLATVLLRNAAGDRGLSLSFAKKQLPCFTLWKNTQADEDGCVTGLEPGTNYPNLKTFEREHGRVISLAPGASYETTLELRVHDSSDSVAEVEEQIRSSHPAAAQLHAAPAERFSPGA